MFDYPQPPSVWIAVALALMLGLQTLRLWWSSAWPRIRAWRRQSRARAGEEAAADLLRSLGYEVEETQAQAQWTIAVDGEVLPITVRADYLVRRAGRRFVAEVKTGDSAPSLRTAGTRRQLLEYRLAYPVDGVLLVDMERGRIHEVEFPMPELSGSALTHAATRVFAVAVAALVGLTVGYALGAYSGSAGGAVSVNAGSSNAGSSNIGSPASAGNATSTSSRP